MLPEDARLAHDLLALRHNAAALEDAAITHQAADFADVVLLVDGRCFRLLRLVEHPVHLQCMFGCVTTDVSYAIRHYSSEDAWVCCCETVCTATILSWINLLVAFPLHRGVALLGQQLGQLTWVNWRCAQQLVPVVLCSCDSAGLL